MRYHHPDAARPNIARSASGFELSISDQEKQQRASILTAEERRVLLLQGTEPPFCGGLTDHEAAGTYHCRLCELPLFSSEHKFHSGSGWPSFYQAIDADHVRYLEDASHGMWRVEIRCRRCDSHLGHVFPDGPKPSGWRFCVNSISLTFHMS